MHEIMHDIFAYYESRAGTTTLTAVAGLGGDSAHTVNGDNIVVPSDFTEIILATANLSNVTDLIVNAQFQSPNMKQYMGMYADIQNLQVTVAGSAFPIGVAAGQILNPLPIESFLTQPLKLAASENLQFHVQSTAATAANLITGVAMLGDGVYTLPKEVRGQPIFHNLHTTATAAVAHTWTNQVLAASQAWPAGKYALIGLRAVTPTGHVARLRNLRGTSGAPGAFVAIPGTAGAGSLSKDPEVEGKPIFRNGNLGIWGYFSHNDLPQIEILATAADAAANCLYTFDAVKVA